MTEPDRSAAAHVTTHVADGLARLTGRWRDRAFTAPRTASAIDGILSAWLTEVQLVEDALWSTLVLTIATATDDQLAQYGVPLKVSREGVVDDGIYRALIRAATLAIGSSGTGDEIRAVLYAIKGTVGHFAITERFPASLVVEPVAAIDPPAAMVHAIVRRAVAAGVRLLVVDVPIGDTFAFSDTDETVTDAARGFSDTAGLVGGRLVGVIDA